MLNKSLKMRPYDPGAASQLGLKSPSGCAPPMPEPSACTADGWLGVASFKALSWEKDLPRRVLIQAVEKKPPETRTN